MWGLHSDRQDTTLSFNAGNCTFDLQDWQGRGEGRTSLHKFPKMCMCICLQLRNCSEECTKRFHWLGVRNGPITEVLSGVFFPCWACAFAVSGLEAQVVNCVTIWWSFCTFYRKITSSKVQIARVKFPCMFRYEVTPFQSSVIVLWICFAVCNCQRQSGWRSLT